MVMMMDILSAGGDHNELSAAIGRYVGRGSSLIRSPGNGACHGHLAGWRSHRRAGYLSRAAPMKKRPIFVTTAPPLLGDPIADRQMRPDAERDQAYAAVPKAWVQISLPVLRSNSAQLGHREDDCRAPRGVS